MEHSIEHRLFELIPRPSNGEDSLLSSQAIMEAKQEIEKLGVGIDLMLDDDGTNILSVVQFYPPSDERDDFMRWLIQNGSSPFLTDDYDVASMHYALNTIDDSVLILNTMLESEPMSIISILRQVAFCIAKSTEDTRQFFLEAEEEINSVEKLKETFFDKFLDACLEIKLKEPQKKDLIDYLEFNFEIRNIEDTENIAFAEFSLTQEKIESFEQKLLKVTSPLSLFKTTTNYLIKEGLNEDKVNRLEKEGNLPKDVVERLKIRLKR